MSSASRCSTTIRAIARFRNHLWSDGMTNQGACWRAAAGQGLLVGRHVVVPELSLLVVGLADLPLLGRIVEPLLEASQLLFLGDVEVELENVRVVLDELLLERVDLVVPARPDRLRDQIVDADDEHVLVVRAIEDGHFSPGRRRPVNPPQEVVCQLLGGRLLEPRHATALRVHRAQDVVDRPVLAARVHPLQADQERAPSIGVEQLLELAQLLRSCSISSAASLWLSWWSLNPGSMSLSLTLLPGCTLNRLTYFTLSLPAWPCRPVARQSASSGFGGPLASPLPSGAALLLGVGPESNTPPASRGR